MELTKKIVANTNLGLAVLLVFLYLFDQNISLPGWLMPLGRMHPLLLHLPIGMFTLAVILFLFRSQLEKKSLESILGFILSLTALTALASALAGLFLAAEPGAYAADELALHQNSGMAFALGVYILASFYPAWPAVLTSIGLLLNLGLMVFAGHQGASITHGKDFLFPAPSGAGTIAIEGNTIAYSALIQPIFDQKCVSCHKPTKSKGDLVLADSSSVIQGGKNGRLFIAGQPELSLLWQRISLPLSAEEHMPPDGKPQLTQEEMETLRYWILSGASFSQTINAYSEQDSFYIIANRLLQRQAEMVKNYTFPPASPADIEALNTSYRALHVLHRHSPALQATYFLASAFSAEKLVELTKVKGQLISLNLNNMPVEDKDLDLIAKFTELEKLALNGTKITSRGVEKLQQLPKLEHLSLVNTAVSKDIEPYFAGMKALNKLFLSDTRISADDIAAWQKKYPQISFFYTQPDSVLAELSPPILENENTVISADEAISLTHPITGVMIKYTTDGSLPDSTKGMVYQQPFKINSAIDIQTIAFKDGWQPSEPITYNIFMKGNPPEKCRINTTPSDQYPGTGASTFTNGERAPITNLKDQNWIAFRAAPFSATFSYPTAKAIQKISFGYALHVPQYVFAPTWIKVYAGHSAENMSLQKQVNLPPFDLKNKDQVKLEAVHIPLEGKPFTHFRIEAQNLPVIPSWHPGKGEKGWLFIDEIFFYE